MIPDMQGKHALSADADCAKKKNPGIKKIYALTSTRELKRCTFNGLILMVMVKGRVG